MHDKIVNVIQTVNSIYARHGHGLEVSTTQVGCAILVSLLEPKENIAASFVVDLSYANDQDLVKYTKNRMNKALRECGKSFMTAEEFRA